LLPGVPSASTEPWSFVELEQSDPARLASLLSTAGLPSSWRPEGLP